MDYLYGANMDEALEDLQEELYALEQLRSISRSRRDTLCDLIGEVNRDIDYLSRLKFMNDNAL